MLGRRAPPPTGRLGVLDAAGEAGHGDFAQLAIGAHVLAEHYGDDQRQDIAEPPLPATGNAVEHEAEANVQEVNCSPIVEAFLGALNNDN